MSEMEPTFQRPADIGALALALAKAQGAYPTIERSREVTVQKKAGGSYTFKYAPLDTILAAVRAPLSANGLAITQLLEGQELVTLLLHESGASLSARVKLPSGETVQQLGSAITYLRRYALQAMLGVAAEEDDDGNEASGNQSTRRDRVGAAIDAEQAAAEAYARAQAAQRPIAAPAVSQADITALHAQFGSQPAAPFSPDELADIEPSGGMTTAELFQAAEDAGVPRARLTLSAKSMFGANRWKVSDLTDEERAALWAEVAPVTA